MAADDDMINKHANRVGIPASWIKKFIRVESGGNANAKTGSYHGLLQLSHSEFTANGGSGSIYDPEQNIMAGANKIAKERLQFKNKYNREATIDDLYMIHQQGSAGYDAHMANPDKPAWQNMRSTGEGQQKGDRWAKAAIWGNLTPAAKAKFGSVENVTSQQFTHEWGARLDGSPEGVVSRGRVGIKWHRSRGDPETEPQEPKPDKPQFDPASLDYSTHIPQPAPFQAPQVEAPSFALRPVQKT